MPILISHRGNISGPNRDLENRPTYIEEAIRQGYDVEIDVWFADDWFLLGHDSGVYSCREKFLQNPKLWCHAKNLEALHRMLRIGSIHCFWHENDAYTLTSEGYIWAFPRKPLTKQCICVMPEIYPDGTDFTSAAGICSDNISLYKNL